MSHYAQEVRSQPALWRHFATQVERTRGQLPRPGQRLAIAGCGTSYYVAGAYAALREAAGAGESDAFAASQAPRGRRYDAALALSRSGTTSEVLRWLRAQPSGVERYAIVGTPETPVAAAAGNPLLLDAADEQSIVQTRFATSTLALLRAGLGEDVATFADQADGVLAAAHPFDAGRFDHFVFLGEGFGAWLAQEAALKMRETTGAWTEAYPAPEYRHGPVSAASERTLVWALGHIGDDVLEHATTAGATVQDTGLDPMVELVRVHLQAEAEAERRGRDIDVPPHLSRSVVLSH